jgi:hypothetical protein
MSESSSIERGGGQIGRTGSSHGAEGDDDEARKRRSDTAWLRGSYHYTKYSLTPSPAFSKCEAKANCGGSSLSSALASTSCSHYHAGSSASASAATSSALAHPRVRMDVDAPLPATGDRREDHRFGGLRR